MAKEMGLALTPWAPMAGGALSGKYLKGEQGRVKDNSTRRSEKSNLIAEKVLDVATKMGVSPAQVAIRWTMQKDLAPSGD